MTTLRKYLIGVSLLIIVTILSWAGNTPGFKLLSQWKHDITVTSIAYSMVDKNDHVLMVCMRNPLMAVTKDKAFDFAPRGLGPGDLLIVMAITEFQGDVAVAENQDRIKIFSFQEGKYHEKNVIWLKRGPYPHIIKSLIFFDDKWFFAGRCFTNFDRKIHTGILVKVYDRAGKPLAELLPETWTTQPEKKSQMHHFITGHNESSRVFYLIESELKVTEICPKALKVLNTVNLECPSFYKSMPAEFYVPRNYSKDSNGLLKDLEYWRSSYSRIHFAEVVGDQLLLQVRTCDKKLKNYALLFYNLPDFKLEKTIYIDDLILGVRNGKYYFHANGDHTTDEGADNFVIKLYELVPEGG